MEKKVEAKRVLRFGTVGTNFIVDKFLEAAKKEPNFVLAAVYSRTSEKASAFAAKHNCDTYFTDLKTMAASAAIDAVYIASPTYLHKEHSVLFLNNSKHVLCEKPASSTAKEFEAIMEAATRNQVAFMEAMRQLYAPNFEVVRQNVSEIAPVRHFMGMFCQLSSRWPAYLRGERPNAFQPELSNGCLMDIGCYAVAAAVNLFGAPDAVSYTANMLDTGVDASGTLTLAYGSRDRPGANDKIATLIISKQCHGFSCSELQGEKGTLRIDNLGEFSKIQHQSKGGSVKDLSLPQEKNNLVYEVRYFIKEIFGGTFARTTLQATRDTMKVLDQARKQAGIVFPADSSM